jgi:hypothetical protein
MVGGKNEEGRHFGLDSYELLIEALKIPSLPEDDWNLTESGHQIDAPLRK